MSIHFTPWQISDADFPFDGCWDEKIRFLVRYAILAPSSHNTQPWKFRVEGNQVGLLLDFEGWLEVADSDQRELHISIGCALENLLVAAEHFGIGHQAVLLPDAADGMLAATVRFHDTPSPSPRRPGDLFPAITLRHTNHRRYADRSVPQELLERLQLICTDDELCLFLTKDPAIKLTVDELVVRGDAVTFADARFRAELGHWIGKGVFGASWLMSKLGQLAVRHVNIGESQGEKDSAVLMSSPVLGVLCSVENNWRSQIKAGQAYERLCLQAAAHGVWTQPISQIVEIPELKQELADVIPIVGVIPQHPFRMGYAEPEDQHTPRKPIAEVLIAK